MSIFDSISRSIKNVFVGSHKGDDFKYDPPEGEYLPELDGLPTHPYPNNGSNRYHPDPNFKPEPVNTNGFTFENPLDSMPIATDNPRPEEEIADDWFVDTVKEKSMEEKKSIHQEMYEIATARNNPFHVGGSENAQSEVDYIKKHSPWGGGSENFQERKKK